MGHFQYQGFNKFAARRTELNGYSFASKLEADLYLYLKTLVHAGEIKELTLQPQVKLTRAGILMKPDFRARDSISVALVFFEAKGFETPEYRLKRKLWSVYGPGVLKVYKRRGKDGLILFEEISPKDPKEI